MALAVAQFRDNDFMVDRDGIKSFLEDKESWLQIECGVGGERCCSVWWRKLQKKMQKLHDFYMAFFALLVLTGNFNSLATDNKL